jgi:hypothetical protein
MPPVLKAYTSREKNDRLSKMSGMLLNLLGINEDTLALPGCFFDKGVCHARICFAPLLARFSSVLLLPQFKQAPST